MINTLSPGSKPSTDPNRDKILEQISHEYGKPEEKQREAVKKMGKDEFFKLLINQVQHQDPLKPYDNEQMAAQMAQFTSLEQMVNMNNNLEKLQASQLPLQNLGAANLIGKFVTVDASHIQHVEGKFSKLNFDMPKDAAKVRVVIVNERGENVREIEKADIKAGAVSLEWDGKKANNLQSPTGNYTLQISAIDAQERPIMIKTTNTQMVHGIGFEGKDTVLYAGDLNRPTKISLKDVSRIIDASQIQQQPGGGMGGLTDMIKAQLAAQGGGAAEGGGEPTPPQIQEEQTVPDSVAGQNAKFSPIDMNTIKKMQAQPEYAPPPSADDLKRAAEGRQDLSEANLAAQDAAAGRLPAQIQEQMRDEINPAAEARGYGTAGRKSVPSGADFSTAGKLAE